MTLKQIRQRVLQLFGLADRTEVYNELFKAYSLLNELSVNGVAQLENQLKINGVHGKLIENVNMQATCGLYRLELVLKHGCFDCFSVDGEWHKEDCKLAGTIVRRENGRQSTGKC